MEQEGWVLPSPTYTHNGSCPSRNGHRQQPVNCQQVQRLGLRRIFTKLEQLSWLKLKQAGAKLQKSYRGLEEACGTAALPYRIVARWVQAFRCRPLRPHHKKRCAVSKVTAALPKLKFQPSQLRIMDQIYTFKLRNIHVNNLLLWLFSRDRIVLRYSS